jgi:hypothetical protein
MSAHLRLVTPRNENRSVPIRLANAELRTRAYLTAKEVEKLTKAARDCRYGHRDATLILIAFRHGLRACEICDPGMVAGRVRPIGITACPPHQERQAIRPPPAQRRGSGVA